MARTLKTPGATENTLQPEEQIKTEGSLPEIYSIPQLIQESNQFTSGTSEQTNDDFQRQLDEINQTQKSIENKLDQLLAAGGIKPQPKKRWVQGKHSLEFKEV